MSRTLIGVLAVLIVTGAVKAQEQVSPEQVNKNPQKYVGQTLVFDRMRFEGFKLMPSSYHFTMRTPHGTPFAPSYSDNQRIIFHTPGKRETVKAFIETLPTKGNITVRVTCQLRVTKDGRFIAGIRRFDIVRFDCSQELSGEVLNDVSPEEINQDPAKYLGKTLVFDGVSLTGQTAPLRVRTRLEVKSAAGVVFGTTEKDDQKFLFAIYEKDKPAMAYLEPTFRY